MSRRKRPAVDACFFVDEKGGGESSKATSGSTGQSIPLVLFEEGGFRVNDDALDILAGWEPPLAVVAVAGLYRTGKSFLLNRVILQGGGKFTVGPTTRACTKGIWMWTEPIVVTDAKGRKTHVVVVDTEGIGAPTADATHDTRIFALGLLLSSYFIYNSVGSIDEQALSNMSLVTNLSKEIRGSVKLPDADESMDDAADAAAAEGEVGLKHSFPAFLWVVRDFALQLRDADGRAIGAKEYLEDALKDCASKGAAAAGKNRIRSTLRAFFPERDCYTMVRPCTDEAQLQLLDTLPDEQLRPEFLEQAAQLRARIVAEAQRRPLKVNDCELSGSMLGLLCRQYVEAINAGHVPVIQDAWSYVCLAQRGKTADKLVAEFQAKLQALPSDPSVVTPAQFSLACSRAVQAAHAALESTCASLFPGESCHDALDELDAKLKPLQAAAVAHFQTNYVATLHKAVTTAQREVEARQSRQEFQSILEFRRALQAAHDAFLSKYVDADIGTTDEAVRDSANAAWFTEAETLVWRTVHEFGTGREQQLSLARADADRLQAHVQELTKAHAAALSSLERTLKEEAAASSAAASQRVAQLQEALEEATTTGAARTTRIATIEAELLQITEESASRGLELQQSADKERLRAEAAERKVAQLREDLSEAEEELAKMEQVTRELEQVKQDYKRLHAELAETRHELEEQRRTQRTMEASFKKEATEMQQKVLQSLQTMKEKRNSVEAKLRAKQDKCTKLEEKCEKAEERARHMEEELQRSNSHRLETIASLEQTVQQLRSENDGCATRLRLLEVEREKEVKDKQKALEHAASEFQEERVRMQQDFVKRIKVVEEQKMRAEGERDSFKRELDDAAEERERWKRMRRDDNFVPRRELVVLEDKLARLAKEGTETAEKLQRKNKELKQQNRELEDAKKSLDQRVFQLEYDLRERGGGGASRGDARRRHGAYQSSNSLSEEEDE